MNKAPSSWIPLLIAAALLMLMGAPAFAECTVTEEDARRALPQRRHMSRMRDTLYRQGHGPTAHRDGKLRRYDERTPEAELRTLLADTERAIESRNRSRTRMSGPRAGSPSDEPASTRGMTMANLRNRQRHFVSLLTDRTLRNRVESVGNKASHFYRGRTTPARLRDILRQIDRAVAYNNAVLNRYGASMPAMASHVRGYNADLESVRRHIQAIQARCSAAPSAPAASGSDEEDSTEAGASSADE